MGDVGVPGVENVTGLANWLTAHDRPGAGGDLTGELARGGPRNLPSRVIPRALAGAATAPAGPAGGAGGGGGAGPAAPATSLVLRRPPLGHVLPTAHDMGR